jgi:hypothetical protein
MCEQLCHFKQTILYEVTHGAYGLDIYFEQLIAKKEIKPLSFKIKHENKNAF